MNWLDFLLGLILAVSLIAGLARGLIRTAIGITAAIFAFVLALWFYGTVGAIFSDYVSSKAVSNFLGFIVVFALVILTGSLLGRLLAKLFKAAGLSWLDRLLGGCFGFLRGLLISIALVMSLTAFSVNPPPDSVVNSVIAPYVIDAAHMLSRLAPRELTEAFQASYQKIRKLWSEAAARIPPPPKPTTH